MNALVNPTLQVAQLLRVLRQVEGRKKLHKVVHILQELGWPFPERFDYSYYGMYSRELRAEVDSLVQDKLIKEKANPNMAGERTYTFESTPELEEFLDSLRVEKQPPWVALARQLNGLHTQVLEGISTVLFLRSRGLHGEDLQRRFGALKPHLKGNFIRCETEARTLLARRPGAVPA
ncbi:MAG: hypothetical protein HYY24_07575 [Verrucomicrobia bacterium]|nr:hypothetical protein [Verrucomicrobiota bacterium]